MKLHILFESSDHTNGRIVGVWTGSKRALYEFIKHCEVVADRIGDHEFERSLADESVELHDNVWSYLPDDTEEHSNVKVMLFLDVEVAG